MSEAAHEVYTRLLLRKKNGYPLWIPEPNDFLPQVYRERGVSVGDVGIVTPDGAFDFLFNICLAYDHPINLSNGVPEGFSPVTLGATELRGSMDMFPAGMDIASKSIKKTQLTLSGASSDNPLIPAGIGAGLQFKTSTSEGAILLLPRGGSRTDLSNRKKFREYATINAPNWYNFANGPLGREAANGSLYLITGCDKSSSWGIASFADESAEGDISLKFKAAQVAEGSALYAYSWETYNSATVRIGHDPLRGNQTKNQCLFVRGFKISLREGFFASLFGPIRISPVLGDPAYTNSSKTFADGSVLSRFSRGSGTGVPGQGRGRAIGPHDSAEQEVSVDVFETDVLVDSFPGDSDLYHPSAAINNYLLNHSPDCQVAITHDDDWCSLIEDDDNCFVDDEELINRIQERYELTMAFNGVFLTLKRDDYNGAKSVNESHSSDSLSDPGASLIDVLYPTHSLSVTQIADFSVRPDVPMPAKSGPLEVTSTNLGTLPRSLIGETVLSETPAEVTKNSDDNRNKPSQKIPVLTPNSPTTEGEAEQDRVEKLQVRSRNAVWPSDFLDAFRSRSLPPGPILIETPPTDRVNRRRTHPNSYDELDSRPPGRSRIGSMINFDGDIGSSDASVSTLMSRDALDESAVRQTLILREEGKPLRNFQIGDCIGRGQFGRVYRALNLNTGQIVAIKRIRLGDLKEEELAQLMKDVTLVKSLSHPNIVKYEGISRDQNMLSIVLEYAEGGSVGQNLKAFGKLNEFLVMSYVVKILDGLYYLHQNDIVHCNLKAANIFCTKNGDIKLADFGVSLNLRAMEREIKDVVGTPNWMAPEVIELKGASTKSDIWSLACTVIELLTGRPPYADIANSMAVMFRIVEDDMPPIPEECSELLQDFLRISFNKDPTLRPGAETLCNHDWLNKKRDTHSELRPQDGTLFPRQYDYVESAVVLNDSSDGVERPISESSLSLKGPAYRGPIPPREHSFIRTTFSKPMTCRVCLLDVKKSALLCEHCSLPAHSKCAENAPPTCGLREQLVQYAQFAEQEARESTYTHLSGILDEEANYSSSSHSEGLSSIPISRLGADSPASQPTTLREGEIPPHFTRWNPSTGTVFGSAEAFKRSRGSISLNSGQSSGSSSRSIARQSLSSTGTTVDTSSLWSAEDSERIPMQRAERGVLIANSGVRKLHPLAEEETGRLRPSEIIASSSAAVYQEDSRSQGRMLLETARQNKRDRGTKSTKNCVVQ